MKKKIIIMGAAGRDFHNFNLCFRHDPSKEVVAFTANQIPEIGARTYPAALAGPLYPTGIPVHAEAELAGLIKEFEVDGVVFAYSDVRHEEVMHAASLVLSLGADFTLIGPKRAMLESKRPVIAVTAVRTGCGKSSVSRFTASIIRDSGKRLVIIRHPMPYGDLASQRLQKFSTLSDLDRYKCTIEEMEEYEPIVEAGFTVFAGVDYKEILARAEHEADVIIWDGGNNDFSFVRPDLLITLVDPLRAGDETAYHPGETNLLMADTVVINKAESACPEDIDQVLDSINTMNPCAAIVEMRSNITIDHTGSLRGKRVLVIEDGPTLTHGSMRFGAGVKAAELAGAIEVDPRPYAVGTIKDTLQKYPSLGQLVPAMGYSDAQRADLEATVRATPCDAVLVATPVDLKRIINIDKPAYRVRYEVEDIEEAGLESIIVRFIDDHFD